MTQDYVDGIHLDYVRYCDVILPVNLWQNYGIEQTRELPEYDFCYCETCRAKYKAEHGVDPLEHPISRSKFIVAKVPLRPDLKHVVNSLAEIAKGNPKKQLLRQYFRLQKLPVALFVRIGPIGIWMEFVR